MTNTDPKKEAARRLLRVGGWISTQVVNEFANTARRTANMPWPLIADWLDNIEQRFAITPLTVNTSRKALSIAERHQLHIYDANIWAAAILAGCDTLYSEDMHHGLTIEGVTLRDPFAA